MKVSDPKKKHYKLLSKAHKHFRKWCKSKAGREARQKIRRCKGKYDGIGPRLSVNQELLAAWVRQTSRKVSVVLDLIEITCHTHPVVRRFVVTRGRQV